MGAHKRCDGASLLGRTPAWPRDLGTAVTVYAATDDGDELTLVDGWIKTVSFSEVARVTASTLLLNGHHTPTARFERAYYSTAHLTEWRGDSGLSFTRRRHGAVTVNYTPSSSEQFALPGALISFVDGAQVDPVSIEPRWSIQTQQLLRVEPRRPATATDLFRRYAVPLGTFTAFAADRPDRITHEMLVRDGRRFEVWRAGPAMVSRPWRPNDGFIFRADDLSEDARPMRAWWRVYRKVWPALDFLAEHVQYENSYTPARLMTIYTALEAYARERHGTKDLRKLRAFAEVPNDIIGCSNPRLTMIDVSRGYFAHLEAKGPKYSRESIEDRLLQTTRTAGALLQACLLRDLGFGKRRRAELLAAHYRNWPLS